MPRLELPPRFTAERSPVAASAVAHRPAPVAAPGAAPVAAPSAPKAFAEANLNDILWMDEILKHLATMGNQSFLVFAGESSFEGLRWCGILSTHRTELHGNDLHQAGIIFTKDSALV